jgi:hypothetical protein
MGSVALGNTIAHPPTPKELPGQGSRLHTIMAISLCGKSVVGLNYCRRDETRPDQTDRYYRVRGSLAGQSHQFQPYQGRKACTDYSVTPTDL